MLALRNLTKYYRTERSVVPAVRDVSLEIPRGTFFTLLGPSGCGKTTILHCIAGLETPDAGDIEIDGVTVFSAAKGCNEPPHRRRLGMVFQSYAIWPHMTVFDNVAFPLQQNRPRLDARDIRTRVMAALERVKLETMADKLAPFLSGGQQQRVALARALVHEPRLLLLDEPLSNLDAKLREEMRLELGRLVREVGITTVFVTHDQVEALTMSHRIALIAAGRVVQQGAPHDIYYRPCSVFAARFVGGSSIIPGTVISLRGTDRSGEIDTPFGRVLCALPADAVAGGGVDLVVRPDSLRVCNCRGPADPQPNFFRVNISQTSFIGDFLEGIAYAGATPLRVRFDPHAQIGPEHAAVVELVTDRCVVLVRKE